MSTPSFVRIEKPGSRLASEAGSVDSSRWRLSGVDVLTSAGVEAGEADCDIGTVGTK
jgi:hypothetical protein